VPAVVVGCGTWGTVFAGLLRDRGHDVELACRDPEQAAAINGTARNPRYATGVDLSGVTAAGQDGAAYEEADLVVLAVPSRVFGAVVSSAASTGWGSATTRRRR
jgi:glycerol-3-phosphate dehydrogenase